MYNITKELLLLALIITFFSCENETFEQQVLESTTQENDIPSDMVTFSPLTGNIGKSFSFIDGKVKTIQNLEEALLTEAKFLYVDTDEIKNLQYSYEDLLIWSSNSKVGIIFESATATHSNTQEFYTNSVGGAALDYTAEALVVEQSQEEDRATFIVVNSEHSMDADDTVKVFFEELYESKFPMVLESESVDTEFYDNDNPIITVEESQTKGGYTTIYNVTYKNIGKKSAETKAKALALKRAGNNSKFSGFSSHKKNIKVNVISKKNGKRIYLKKGGRHSAVGRCRNQQYASYERSLDYSRDWSTSVDAGITLGAITFGGSISYGGSRTKGTTNGSGLYMRKEYAEGGVSTQVKYVKGSMRGTFKFVASAKKQIRGNVRVNVTVKYTGTKMKWQGWRAQTKPAFTWQAWGKLLRNCN